MLTLTPTGLRVTAQRALLGGSEFELAWAGAATTYNVLIGSAQDVADVAQIETKTPALTWQAPRAGSFFVRVIATTDTAQSPPTGNRLLVSVDLRDVIDAMLFSSGQVSETQRTFTGDSVFSIWPDGQRITVLVAPDVAESVKAEIVEFVDQFASITNGAVTASVLDRPQDMKGWRVSDVPPNSIAGRVLTLEEMAQAGICTVRPGVGCSTGGPPALDVAVSPRTAAARLSRCTRRPPIT